ncbi:armadillo-type protein, partial [Mycena olivaceomarginata]
IHSWWSDSNPGLRGPTLNLHAMAKPLLRRMHDRQALGRIETSRAAHHLSSEMMLYFSSYLPHDYVFSSTKAAILVEKDDAHSIVDDSIALGQITKCWNHRRKKLRAAACGVFGSLAQHESTALKTLHINTCMHLISLLWDDNDEVALIDNAIYHVLELLASPRRKVRETLRKLVETLAHHEFTWLAILELKSSVRPRLPAELALTAKRFADGYATPLLEIGLKKATGPVNLVPKFIVLLVSLLHDQDDAVIEEALMALSRFAETVQLLHAGVDAKALDHPKIQERVWSLLKYLAFDEYIPAFVLDFPKLSLSLLSSHKDIDIREALKLLSHLTFKFRPHGARAFCDTGELDRLTVLLESQDEQVRRETCRLLGVLATHKYIIPDIVGLNISAQLVTFLRDTEHQGDMIQAADALHWITMHMDGAHDALDAGLFNVVSKMVESSSAEILQCAIRLLGSLTSHASTAAYICGLNPYLQLRIASRLRRVNANIRRCCPSTPPVIGESDLRMWTWWFVLALAYHDATEQEREPSKNSNGADEDWFAEYDLDSKTTGCLIELGNSPNGGIKDGVGFAKACGEGFIANPFWRGSACFQCNADPDGFRLY